MEKMNLNPLKKDDNTDALVKALEDANNVGGQTTASTDTVNPSVDSATIAADPQITNDGVSTDSVPSGTTVNPLSSTDESLSTTDETSDSTSTSADNSASGLTFDGTDLPMGLSSDAGAHLPSEGSGDNGELDGVKKSALEQLRPLIEKIDLEPADKFDKYLMMLRASDDPALIKPAFDAAQGISGEKEKAQALLDIINEINYITSNQQQTS